MPVGLGKWTIAFGQHAIVRERGDDLPPLVCSQHRRIDAEVQPGGQSLGNQAERPGVPVENREYSRHTKPLDHYRLGAARVDSHDLVSQRWFGQEAIEDSQLGRLGALAVSREIEPDLADVLSVWKLANELAHFEWTGSGCPEWMQAQRHPDSAVAAKPRCQQPVPAR